MPWDEKSRSEPEIIPPDHAERRTAQDTQRTQVFVDTRGTERVYIAKPGPLGLIVVALTTVILSVLLLTLLLGAFLIWVPLVIAFVAGAIIAGFLRAYFRRAP